MVGFPHEGKDESPKECLQVSVLFFAYGMGHLQIWNERRLIFIERKYTYAYITIRFWNFVRILQKESNFLTTSPFNYLIHD